MERIMKAITIIALVAAMTSSVAKGDHCSYFTAIPGGCPNIYPCWRACAGCYRGTGNIQAECMPPQEGLLPYWQCTCTLLNGAPCPTGAPACPNPPPGVPNLALDPANWVVVNASFAVFHNPVPSSASSLSRFMFPLKEGFRI